MLENNKDKIINNQEKKLLDISLIGNTSTGKTSIIKTYQNKRFEKDVISTIGFELDDC